MATKRYDEIISKMQNKYGGNVHLAKNHFSGNYKLCEDREVVNIANLKSTKHFQSCAIKISMKKNRPHSIEVGSFSCVKKP